MVAKYNYLYSAMKMLIFPSSLTLAPIKLIKTEDDVFPTLHLGKQHHRVLSFIFIIVLSCMYFKVKVYDSLQMGKAFFVYIRSLATFIEIGCLVGNMFCYNFGARKTVKIYKKMKKIMKNNLDEMDYRKLRKLFTIELVLSGSILTVQFFVYCYLFFHPIIILIYILDSNITVLVTATCVRHYNMAKILEICLDKLLKTFDETTNAKQLQKTWTLYLEIYGVIKSNNEFLGLGLSCSLAVLYVYCLIALFGIFSFANTNPSLAVINILWFCVELGKIMSVVFGTCICEVNAKKLNAHLGCYNGEEYHLEEINSVRCKLTGSKIKFSACGFFDTDASLLYKLIGGLLLNLTILLQFGKKFQK